MTEVLELYWERNKLANEAFKKGLTIDLSSYDEKIKNLRGSNPPPCWGEDDCSTLMLSRCPWSIDCG